MLATRKSGFTIVELLIVIVVIAILAAITIVAYNGIQNRARTSALSSSLQTAAKKILLYQVEDPGNNPADLASVGITDTDSIKYKYRVNTSVTPSTYCITATTAKISYFVSTTDVVPQAGACPGDGLNGGQVITNLVPNPSLESNMNSWIANYGTGGSAASGSPSLETSGGYSGNNFYRMKWGTGSTALGRGAEHGQISSVSTIKPNTPYSGSVWVRTTRAQTLTLAILYTNSSGSGISYVEGTSQVVSPGTWTKLVHSSTSPGSTVGMALRIYSTAAGSTNWQANDTLDVDALMVTEGTTVNNYADGNSSNWIWNGATNNSPSTGMPL